MDPTQPNPWVNPTHGQLWISCYLMNLYRRNCRQWRILYRRVQNSRTRSLLFSDMYTPMFTHLYPPNMNLQILADSFKREFCETRGCLETMLECGSEIKTQRAPTSVDSLSTRCCSADDRDYFASTFRLSHLTTKIIFVAVQSVPD